ncbi:hypothetical protein GOB57_24955 [Sinorhizobium meliloti]|nr:hypothetical protein [Sinorhizobium meliloti]
MQSEDIIISKLLSLRFYEFSEGDKGGLTSNIRANGIKSGVSEAARVYLRTALERGMAEAGHLACIAEWLDDCGNDVDRGVVDEYRETVREMTLNAIFPRRSEGGASRHSF